METSEKRIVHKRQTMVGGRKSYRVLIGSLNENIKSSFEYPKNSRPWISDSGSVAKHQQRSAAAPKGCPTQLQPPPALCLLCCALLRAAQSATRFPTYCTVGTHRSAIFLRSSASWPANTVRYTYGQLNRAQHQHQHPVLNALPAPSKMQIKQK